MLYGNIAVVDQMPFANDAVLDDACARPQRELPIGRRVRADLAIASLPVFQLLDFCLRQFAGRLDHGSERSIA